MPRTRLDRKFLGWCIAAPLLGLCKLGFAQCTTSQATIDVTQSNVYSTAFPLTLSAPTLVTVESGVTAFNDGSNASNGSVIHATSSATCIDVNNYGTIETGSQWAIYNQGSIDAIDNNASGIIESGARRALVNVSGASIGTLINSGTIEGAFMGVDNAGTMGSLVNLPGGVIESTGGSSTDWAMLNESTGVLSMLTNAGTLRNAGTAAPLLLNQSSIAVFNNAQGAGNAAGAVTLGGQLPAQYNVIINSPSSYGQLVSQGATGSMAFDVYGNTGTTLVSGVPASSVGVGRYADVLQGFSSLSDVSGTSGRYQIYAYTLVADTAVADAWDLVFTLAGPSAADTNASTAALGAALSTPFALQSAEFAADLGYDCDTSDSRHACVGAAGSYTALDSDGPHTTAAAVYGALQLDPRLRIGGWADQGVSSQGDSPLIRYGSSQPVLGVFGVWSEHPHGAGVVLRLAAGYGSQDLTLTRPVEGSSPSEPGQGSSTLAVRGAEAQLRYDLPAARGWVASPYLGLRYLEATLGAYSEQASTAVTDPLSFGQLRSQTTTARAGLRIAGNLSKTWSATASLGVVHDLDGAGGSASVTQAAIGSLQPLVLSATGDRTRPEASVGAAYSPGGLQSLGVSVVRASMPFTSQAVTVAQIRYAVGF